MFKDLFRKYTPPTEPTIQTTSLKIGWPNALDEATVIISERKIATDDFQPQNKLNVHVKADETTIYLGSAENEEGVLKILKEKDCSPYTL